MCNTDSAPCRNPGGQITDDIKEMFADADVNGDEVVDFLEFIGMMAGMEGEDEIEGGGEAGGEGEPVSVEG
jgi:hypothetical protein